MPLSLTLPLTEKPTSVKDMSFSILFHQFPLSLIKICNEVNKQYGRSVTFQAVRKAVLQLVEENVVEKTGKEFLINKDWIIDVIKFGNSLQQQYFTKRQKGSKVEVGQNMTVYTLPKLVDLDYVWNGVIRKALSDPKAPKAITFKAEHFWFLIATLAQETELMKEMIRKGVKLYYLCYGNTSLDKWTVDMYNAVGVHAKLMPKPKEFPSGLTIGTYGNTLIQSQYPKKLAKNIDVFFHSCRKPEDASLANITDLVTENLEIPLQVLHDPLVAGAIREEIKRKVMSL